ncbi:MAG TPA: DUF1343 domain-containing protein [Opitutaceae bacterium]|nr:DUF1343 domain-containing protein [Opitutaceae bacterium]
MPSLLPRSLRRAVLCAAPLVGLIGCSETPPPAPAPTAAPRTATPQPPASAPRPASNAFFDPAHPVMLGIDVLESNGFAAIRGKAIGLLTHPAGVNMRGVSTIEVLRHAPGVRLVALFSPEHGLRGELLAGANAPDRIDARTGIMVHSLYNGAGTRPTRAQLKGIDAMVIDLQDIGVRSYTFVSAMKVCMEGCFENGVEVVVLDRPNPLGGLKVDGPPLDAQLVSYVGEFRVPYVHGLTMGEFARMAKEAPDILTIPDAVRQSGRLTVVPMRGWHRSMRWPDTGLSWVPTSQLIPDFSAVEGYAMTGLGTQLGGFRSGIGTAYPFRGLSYHGVRFEALERDLKALNIQGVDFRRVSVPDPKTGKPELGLYVEITDWDLWRPTELGLHLVTLACKYDPRMFSSAPKNEVRVFQKCLGSMAFYNDVAARGAKVDVGAYVRDWQAKAQIFQQQSRKYWMYY